MNEYVDVQLSRHRLFIRVLTALPDYPHTGESDNESVTSTTTTTTTTREGKGSSAARDVAFLQARLQDLMGKLKVLKKEKEAMEANAHHERQRQAERYFEPGFCMTAVLILGCSMNCVWLTINEITK